MLEEKILLDVYIQKRSKQLNRLYVLLDDLKDRVGGYHYLSQVNGEMQWPTRGIYFFFEKGETRQGKEDLRVVRVGTHALKIGSKSTLWERLKQHKGTTTGEFGLGGNHRGSIFRDHVGASILRRDGREADVPQWGIGKSAEHDIRKQELPIERLVSEKIGGMPFIWLRVDNPSGPSSLRSSLEKHIISLLSNYGKCQKLVVDNASKSWLGKWSPSEYINRSGLWNVEHVADGYVDETFLDVFKSKIDEM